MIHVSRCSGTWPGRVDLHPPPAPRFEVRMADIVVSDLGEIFLMRRMLRRSNADDDPLKLHVYTNDYTPDRTVALADVDEAAWSGYSPEELDPDTWSDPATVAGEADSFYGAGPVLFTPLSGVTIAYGAYVTDGAETVLIWAWRFAAPQTVTSSAPCVVDVSFGARSQSEPDPP